MNKKLIRTISWILLFLFINQGYCVRSEAFDVTDGSWEVIDTARVGAGGYLNVLINNLISDNKKKIYIKDGNYNLSDSINIDFPDVTIYGQSNTHTIIKQSQNKVSFKITVNNVQVENLNIDGKDGTVVFHAQNVDTVSLEDCIIYGSNTDPAVAFYGNNTTKSTVNIIKGNGINSGYGQAIIFLNQKNGEVSNNNVSDGSMDFENCYDLKIDHNSVKDSVKGGIKVALPGENIKITWNTIENTKNAGIAVVSSTTTKYEGIEINNNTITNTKYFGLELNNLDGAIIQKNTISEIDFYGMYIIRSDKLNIENNTIRNCEKDNGTNTSWSSGIKATIYLEAGVKESIIKNNIIHNDNTYPCDYGIMIPNNNINNNNSIFNDNTINGSFTTLISANLGDTEYTNILEKDTVTDDTIAIKWIEMNPDTEYEVKENGITVYVGKGESYVHTGLSSSTPYKYSIAITGIGKFSKDLIITTLPSPPQNIKTLTTGNSIKVSWDEVDVATEYEVEVDGNPVFEDVSTYESYEDKGLVSGISRKYRVRVKGGEWSLPVYAKTIAVPKNIKTSATGNSIKVSWDEVDAATEYEVEVDGNPVFEDVSTYESYEDKGLLSGISHKYRVRVKGGEWSSEVPATTTTTTTTTPGVTPSPVVTPPPGVTTPPAANPTNSTTPAAVNISGNGSSSSRRRNHPWYDWEFSLIDEKTLFYKENLIQDTEENKLKRMLLYTFGNKYYISIKTWRKDKSILNNQFEINLSPWKLFTDDEIKNISLDKNDTMDTILVEDMNQQSSLTNPDEETGFSEYSIADGYIFTLGKYGMQLEREQRYIESKELIDL